MNDDWLECQNCGKPLFLMSAEGKQKVAANPQNYIVYCRTCIADHERLGL